MFAPQTLRLRVPQQLENKQISMHFLKFRVRKLLPRAIFPVCQATFEGEASPSKLARLFGAVDSLLANFGVRLYVCDAWVGHKQILSITRHTNKTNILFAQSSRSYSSPWLKPGVYRSL